MHINLHLLRIFHSVVENRSFSQAANKLCITQPAVSKAVRELEQQLELTLIERGPGNARKLQLTADGDAIYRHAQGIFGLEHAALEDIRARRSLQRGRIDIGASLTVAGYWLPGLIAAFSRQHPAIETRLIAGNTQTIAEELIACRIDVAYVEGRIDDPRIEATLWQNEPMSLVASQQAALSRQRMLGVADLSAQTWLLRESGSGTRAVSEAFLRTYGIEPSSTMEIGTNEGLARAVAAQAGVGLLPMVVVRDQLQLGELVQLPFPPGAPLSRPLYRLQLRGRSLSSPSQAFIAHANAADLHTSTDSNDVGR